MGCLSLQSGINAFDGVPKYRSVMPSTDALACMVSSEIGAVLAVMRRNVRWGVRFMADDDQLEHSLILSLKELRKQIFSWKDQWHTINPAVYLQPFLDVIRSDETGAPITGVALSSVYKFLTIDMLDLSTVNVEDAMHLIVDAVTSCRFEVTDPASEEVILMKILQVLLACMKCKASIKLSNQHVCNIVNKCFLVVHQASSKGELLQRIARHAMHELVREQQIVRPVLFPSASVTATTTATETETCPTGSPYACRTVKLLQRKRSSFNADGADGEVFPIIFFLWPLYQQVNPTCPPGYSNFGLTGIPSSSFTAMLQGTSLPSPHLNQNSSAGYPPGQYHHAMFSNLNQNSIAENPSDQCHPAMFSNLGECGIPFKPI